MMQSKLNSRFINIHWKKKDNITFFLIVFIGLLLTLVGIFYNNIYNIFFSTCLGLFIGGIFLSIISTFLAEMESNISGAGEIDADVDVDIDADVDVDIDADVDVDIDADVDVDIDVDIDADVDVDIDADVDVDIDADVDMDADAEIDTGIIPTITPAPIMLLLSAAFLIFGISGILLFQLIDGTLRFIVFFITPLIAYITTKFLNLSWKKLAKSRYYKISSTRNLIGVQGEVILLVDERGGIIKISSNTPMRFEKLHVKPVVDTSRFERGDRVYICDVKDGYLLVDNNKKSIKKRR